MPRQEQGLQIQARSAKGFRSQKGQEKGREGARRNQHRRPNREGERRPGHDHPYQGHAPNVRRLEEEETERESRCREKDKGRTERKDRSSEMLILSDMTRIYKFQMISLGFIATKWGYF